MEVKWIAFPLHPEIPEEGVTLEELFAGGDFDVPAFMDHMKRVAKDCGLPFGMRSMSFNSRRAQELGKWAESLGKGEAFHMAAFQAYFVSGLNIAKESVLEDLAGSLGLDASKVREVLAQGSFRDAVDRDWDYSRGSGITAVPTFQIGNMRVVGAQPYETLEKLVKGSGVTPRD